MSKVKDKSKYSLRAHYVKITLSQENYQLTAAPHLLEGRAVPLHVAAVHLQNLLWPAAHPSAKRLNRGSIYTPLSHAKLPQVGSCVAGQSLTVLKVEPTQLTAGIWKTQGRKKLKE